MTANSGKWQSLFSKVLWVFPLPGVTWGLHRPSQGGWAWSLLQYALLLLLSHFSRVRLCATPQMAAHQALPSLGLSRQEHWSGLPFPSQMHENEKSKWSRSVMSDSLQPHGLQPTRLLRPWIFQARVLEWVAIAKKLPMELYKRGEGNQSVSILKKKISKPKEVGKRKREYKMGLPW